MTREQIVELYNTPRDWYFTFGVESPMSDNIIKIYGTHEDARDKMVEAFGYRWCEQYTAEDIESCRHFKGKNIVEAGGRE